ncbi:MAG: TIGR03009 domain-containing protein [Planctomycetota bacterium]|nr:MAG: TIGR03009 domain-containing protein [Planctomycetota bacterium]
MHATTFRLSLIAAPLVCLVLTTTVEAQQPTRPAPRVTQPAPRRTPTTQNQPNRQLPPTTQQQQQPPARQAAAPRPGAQAQASSGRPVAAPGPAPQPRNPNFQLTPAQLQLLDQVLQRWEQESNRINTFKCNFGYWEVDKQFGPKQNNYILSDGKGYIKYKAPDRGIYRVSELTEWDGNKQVYVPKTGNLDHWVCDGKAIFEFNYEKRQLIERQLAPEMQGKAITDGPLPFIFGAKAQELKRRYWMRDVTPPEQAGKQVWLEAWPKFQQDAANYHHAIVILDQATFRPWALRIIQPDGQNSLDYQFVNIQVNDPLSILKLDFAPPLTPWNWQRVVQPPPGSEQQAQRVAPPESRR